MSTLVFFIGKVALGRVAASVAAREAQRSRAGQAMARQVGKAGEGIVTCG